MKKLILLITAIVTLSLATHAQASTIDIDPFNSPEVGEQYSVSANDLESGGSVAHEVLGGFRTTSTEHVSGALSSGNTAIINGNFAYSSNAGAKIKSLLTWNANGAGLDNVDITQGTSNFNKVGFELDIIAIDQGEVNLTFSLVDSSDNNSSVTVNNLAQGLQYVLLNTMSNQSDFDFTSVKSISLGITQLSDASDLTIDFFGVSDNALATPIPAAIWLFGSGLLGLVGFSKKKKV